MTWVDSDAEDEWEEMSIPDLPPLPPRLSTPSIWRYLACLPALFASQFWWFTGTTKPELFLSGVLASVGGFVLVTQLSSRHKIRQLQRELDAGWETARLKVRMVTKLCDRYGPENAVDAMTTAEHLVEEGDFDDIRAAVAALERHNDMEPTSFDD